MRPISMVTVFVLFENMLWINDGQCVLPTVDVIFLWGFWDVFAPNFHSDCLDWRRVESAVALVFPVTVWVGD